jgi:hypothetical protein
MLPHIARRDMAGIDRCIAGGDQGEDRRLRPLQDKGGFGWVVGGDFRDIVPPRFARIEAQSLGGAAGQQIPGAFDVGRGERLAVMPLTPSRNLKVNRSPSSLHDQLSARSGTIVSRLFWATCWS